MTAERCLLPDGTLTVAERHVIREDFAKGGKSVKVTDLWRIPGTEDTQ